jgi:hypothetical protein
LQLGHRDLLVTAPYRVSALPRDGSHSR